MVLIGGGWVARNVAWPIVEAAIYGVMHTALVFLGGGVAGNPWWKLVLYAIIMPWGYAWQRFAGDERTASEVGIGEWNYRPPFKLWRNHRLNTGVEKTMDGLSGRPAGG